MSGGGLSAAELVAAWGSPLWVYDLEEVRSRAAELFSFLPAGSPLFYSLKANPLPAIAAELLRCGCGAEVSSTGELETALAAGFDGARILYTGPGKTREEIADALAAGVGTFSVESWTDLDRLERAARAAGTRTRILLRVNPADPPKARLAMTGVDSQFGFEEEDLASGGERLARLAPELDLLGLHVYFGTQIGGAEALAAAFQSALEVSERLSARLDVDFRVLDLGGGFPWPYATRDPAPELDALGPALAQLAAGRQRTAGAQLWFEAGRYLCASSGTLLARVMDVKRSRKKTRLILDTGIHHLGGMSGLGRVMRPRVALGAAEGAEREGAESAAAGTEMVDVVGPLCTPLDCLARDIEVPRLQVGDLVAFANVGAYGLTASLGWFLSRPAPVELVHRGGEIVDVYRMRAGHERLSPGERDRSGAAALHRSE